MGNGCAAFARMRFGWLAAIVIPLVLLVGVPADASHGEHEDEHECAVCHSGDQNADLSGAAEVTPTQVPARIELAFEIRTVPSRRPARRPARAPPA